jgi:hypothetical protein
VRDKEAGDYNSYIRGRRNLEGTGHTPVYNIATAHIAHIAGAEAEAEAEAEQRDVEESK